MIHTRKVEKDYKPSLAKKLRTLKKKLFRLNALTTSKNSKICPGFWRDLHHPGLNTEEEEEKGEEDGVHFKLWRLHASEHN